jgi:hypothetical protein
MVALFGLLVSGSGIAVAQASLRAGTAGPRLERWAAVLFLAGGALAGVGIPLV